MTMTAVCISGCAFQTNNICDFYRLTHRNINLGHMSIVIILISHSNTNIQTEALRMIGGVFPTGMNDSSVYCTMNIFVIQPNQVQAVMLRCKCLGYLESSHIWTVHFFFLLFFLFLFFISMC